MADWAGRAGAIALLGFFTMLSGYGWHDITYSSHSREIGESDCNMVFAAPALSDSEDIETCKSYQMSNYLFILGWAMMIIGGIGYFMLPTAGDAPGSGKSQPEKKASKPPEEKPGQPKPAEATSEKVVLLCPKCGIKNDEDAEFCKKCGKRLRPK